MDTPASGSVACLVLALLGSQPSAPDGSASQSYLTARAVLASAVRRLDGLEAAGALGRVSARARGDFFSELQAGDPNAEPEQKGFELLFRIDREKQRYRHEIVNDYAPGFALRFGFLGDGDETFQFWPLEETFAPSRGMLDVVWERLSRFVMPSLLLDQARRHLGSLRSLGTSKVGGEVTDVIEFAWDETGVYRLHVGRTSRLILRLERILPDELVGDDLEVFEYHYGPDPGALGLPAQVTSLRRDRLYTRHTAQVCLDAAPAKRRLFRIPAGYQEVGIPPNISARRLGEGIHLVEGIQGRNYRTPVIEMDDGLLLFDAPLSAAVTSQVVDVIRAEVSPKEIRWVIASHAHGDHAGGLKTYANLGAEILVVPDHTEFLQRIASSDTRLASIDEPSPPATMRLIPVHDELRLPDSRHAVRVVRVDGLPHSEKRLMAFVEGPDLLIHGDMFGLSTDANPAFRELIERARKWHATAVIGVHHGPLSVRELESVYEKSSRITTQLAVGPPFPMGRACSEMGG